ncbi:MAG: ABC transporter permease [Chitinophagaceae bacterium]|nr:ABC transporter permease [Chitinophagaceae bacterium]
MLKTNLLAAIRNMRKHPFFSFVSISGLAVGLAACMLIIQYVNYELSFDHFNTNLPNLYRVVNDRYQQGKRVQHSTMTYSGIGKAMKDEMPDVTNFCRVEPYRVEVISFGDKKIADQRAIATDPSFLSMFSFPLIAGDSRTALVESNSIVVSEKLGRQFFGAPRMEDLLGKVVRFDRDSVPYKITGVAKDVPENSHLNFDLLLSYSTFYSPTGGLRWAIADYNFTQPFFWHYIQLRPGADARAVAAAFTERSNKYFPDAKAAAVKEIFSLQPVKDAHLYSDFEYEITGPGSHTIVWGLLVIGLFILTLAWVNYVNLSTARSLERAKEVGVRKVIGASRLQLVTQFLTESLLINLLALGLATLFVQLVQPVFNDLVHRNLSIRGLWTNEGLSSGVSLLFIGFTAAGIFLSGFYPAFVLSAYRPNAVLKGRFKSSAGGVLFRKVLVTGQFAVTIILITGAFMVYRQLAFMTGKPLGYDMDQMLVLRRPVLTAFDSSFTSKASGFIASVGQLPRVKGAAVSGRIPGDELGKVNGVSRTDLPAGPKATMTNMGVDEHFLNLYKIRLLAGRNFGPTDYNNDLSKVHTVLVNETALRQLEFKTPEDALGKSLTFFDRKWEVAGVVADFHQNSLKKTIEPLLIMPTLQGTYSQFSLKVDPHELSATMADIKKAYADFFPGNVFDYYFLDEKFNRQYASDYLFGKVFGLFAGLAIFIACLGLSGLALLMATQRTKEIGIRKVLGASVSGIIALLSRDFIKLILLAIVLAVPVAWYAMHRWLENFAYRTDMSWWIFAAAGLLALVTALVVIGFQTLRSARANPVKSLRTE